MLELIKRDDITLDVVLTDSEGNAYNLTNKTVFFTMKRNQTDTDTQAVVKKTVTIHTTPLSGETQIELTKSDTDLTPDYYFYDLQVKDTQGRITSADKGQIRVVQDITIRTEGS